MRRQPAGGVGVNVASIPARSREGHVHVLVEIPKGGHNKYELDEALGILRLDRALHSAVYYPAEYGFVPATRSEDGERLDALVLIDEPTFPGCLIETRLVGALVLTGTSGNPEHKLLAVPVGEPRFAEYGDIADVPEHVLREIDHFFEVFKELEGSHIAAGAWLSGSEAHEVLETAIRRGQS